MLMLLLLTWTLVFSGGATLSAIIMFWADREEEYAA